MSQDPVYPTDNNQAWEICMSMHITGIRHVTYKLPFSQAPNLTAALALATQMLDEGDQPDIDQTDVMKQDEPHDVLWESTDPAPIKALLEGVCENLVEVDRVPPNVPLMDFSLIQTDDGLLCPPEESGALYNLAVALTVETPGTLYYFANAQGVALWSNQ